jgi:uncharacterized protein
MLHASPPVQQTQKTERRESAQPSNRIIGAVTACSGAKAVIAADLTADNFKEDWTVSRFLTLVGPSSRIVGMLYNIELPDETWRPQGVNRVRFHVELIGEVVDDPVTGEPRFNRGISSYPNIGSLAHRIRATDLAAIFRNEKDGITPVGVLSQNRDLGAMISVNEMLSKHFAIVGSTGVGKSSAVSLLVRKAVDMKPQLRVLILDPHNEFSHAFPDLAVTLDHETLKLPYWLFKLEELAEVLFRGRDSVALEIEILRELIPMARAQYRASDSRLTVRKASDPNGITADTPLPYRIADLLRLINERAGLLDHKDERPALRMLRMRLESVLLDPRFAFMFGMKRVEDTALSVISQIYRVPSEGRPIACVQLAGLPAEVTNSVASVLARLAFDMAMLSRGAYQILVLAEEAHRYLPRDRQQGFEPTRIALARIAKEGRKYGCFLGCVTQRPGELDPTILSQCSTIFAMRLSNEADQRIIGTAIGDTSASNLAFLPTMAQREAIAFGEAVSTPMRLMFEKLAPSMLPSAAGDASGGKSGAGEVELTRILQRMRNMDMQEIDLDSIEGIESALELADPLYGQRTNTMRAPGESILRGAGDPFARRDPAAAIDDNPFSRLRRDR